MKKILGFLTPGLLALTLVVALPLPAQDDDDVQQTVARIAFLSGSASFSRGDDPDSWEEAVPNFPMTVGDRIYTGRDGRLELQAQGAGIFLAPESELAVLDFRDDIRQLSLTIGTASFRVNRLMEGEVFEVDTPNVSLTFRRPGTYRVDVDRDGNTTASVFKGSAVAVAAGGEVDLEAGDTIQVDGLDQPRYEVVALPRSDSWDRWVDERSSRPREGISLRYASSDIVGLDDLDREGEWQQTPEYGWAWSPPVNVVGWAPYRNGRWTWQDPWGWTWISFDPWGWAPYHYGSWVTSRNRWFWVPVPRTVSSVRYAPARVVFTGGGPDWSAPVAEGGGGFVGWFPIGPSDPFIPWWGRRPSVQATNVPYVNRTFVTVVNRETFVGGRSVDREMVRDPKVIRRAAMAPVLRGPLPILPTTASVRFSGKIDAGAAIRPPRIVEGRAVVTRLAPPPAPPTFQTKMGLIAQTGGMPVSRVSAEKLVAATAPRLRPVVNVRPAGEGGKGILAPKQGSVEVRPVRPVTVPEGRMLSTGERPFQPPPGRAAPPRPDSPPTIRNVEKPVDRGQPRPDTRPEMKPEVKPDVRPVQRNVDRPVDQGQPERRERQPKPEVKQPDRAPAVVQPQPKAEQKAQPPVRVEKAQPAPKVAKPQPAPKAEKPAKPAEETRKDKDKKDR